MIPFQLHRRIPFVRRPFYQRDRALAELSRVVAERDAALSECQEQGRAITELSGTIAERDAALSESEQRVEQRDRTIKELSGRIANLEDAFSKSNAKLSEITKFIKSIPAVLQYRQAYFETFDHAAPPPSLPAARAFPLTNTSLSYKEKLTGLLPISNGKGAEIGPLDIPILSKEESNVLYVDHLDTEGLQEKYPNVANIVPIDRPMVNDSLFDTLRSDGPLDYIVASQVFEHVPNPIRWLHEAAKVLRPGGFLALALPDRRTTFDLLRQESRASDLVSAYLQDAVVPDIRSVYDHHSQAAYINMLWATPLSVTPEEVVDGCGLVQPKRATDNYMEYVYSAKEGTYFDVHAWVYTPPNFLIIMAQLALDGFMPFRCHQFYPTDENCGDRGMYTFFVILEKADKDIEVSDLRNSFLRCLGDNP